MPNTFRIQDLKNRFENRDAFSQDELHEFYKEFDPDLKRSTLRWRIYELKKKNVLKSIKRGWYSLHKKKAWKPSIPEDLRELYQSISNKFPYLTVCVWSTRWLLEFGHHLPVGYLNLIDTGKETEESVFNFLREEFRIPVLLKPTEKEIHAYLDWNRDHLIVRALISQSPLMEIDGVTVPKLEKIIIDLYSDDKLFEVFRGRELQIVYQNLFDQFSINQSTLTRYAMRRNKWEDFREYAMRNLNNVTFD